MGDPKFPQRPSKCEEGLVTWDNHDLCKGPRTTPPSLPAFPWGCRRKILQSIILISEMKKLRFRVDPTCSRAHFPEPRGTGSFPQGVSSLNGGKIRSFI